MRVRVRAHESALHAVRFAFPFPFAARCYCYCEVYC